MKNTYFSSSHLKLKCFNLIVIVAIIMFSCSEDDEDHGASDACDFIVCQNGGACINGACACPPGTQGINCDEVLKPSRIIIRSIQFSGFPAFKFTNFKWDTDGSNAEPFIRISRNGLERWTSKVLFQNADPNGVYTIMPEETLGIRSPYNAYTFSLLDFDDIGSDDFMDSYSADVLFKKENGLPTKLVWDMINCTRLTLEVAYEF